MTQATFEELLDAGCHFGHLRRKWNPNMAPYIFMERNGIHIIDLYKTQAKIDEAANALRQLARSGKKVLFVATKKQAKDIVAELVSRVNMPYVTERWPGGMLTNFTTIRKAVRKMVSIDKLIASSQYNNLSKRERLQIEREREKLQKNLGSIADLNRLPSAVFVVDVIKEHIAVAEARKLNIPTYAIVDTNSNPNLIDFPIPANDDASKSIALIVTKMVEAIEEGLNERKNTMKDADMAEAEGEEEMNETAAVEEEDADLYALDIRGIGECTPTSCDLPSLKSSFMTAAGTNPFHFYGFDYHYASLAWMFGKTYLGGKVKDILCTVELLSQHSPWIELEGHGVGGIPALIAAVLSDKVRKIRLKDVPDSWESMVVQTFPDQEKSPISYVIPGILQDLDMPDLRAAIADKIQF